MTTLDIGGTNVTATATELNLLDGVSGLVQADLTKLAAVDATAAELNVLDMSANGGSSGQILTSRGTGTTPTFQDAPQGVSNSKLFYYGSFS